MDDNSIVEFIKHPALNQSWLAEQLWGSREGKYRTRLSKIGSGIRKLQKDELIRLRQIKEDLAAELNDKFN